MATTTKNDLVKRAAGIAGVTQADTKLVVDAVLTALTEILSKGDSITFSGFGTFTVRDVPARTARNLRTGEEIDVPACKRVAFKQGSALKSAVNA